jgi:hypothetical protein
VKHVLFLTLDLAALQTALRDISDRKTHKWLPINRSNRLTRLDQRQFEDEYRQTSLSDQNHDPGGLERSIKTKAGG